MSGQVDSLLIVPKGTSLARAYMVNDPKNAHVYTLEEAATLLKVKPVTIRRLVLRKKLKKVPFIRHIRIPAGEIIRLVTGVAA